MQKNNSLGSITCLSLTILFGVFGTILLVNLTNHINPIIWTIVGHFFWYVLLLFIVVSGFIFWKNSLQIEWKIIALGLVFLVAGISSIIISSRADTNNPITISYFRDQKLDSSLQVSRPLLSNSPEPPSQSWLFLEYALAGFGSLVYLPLLIISTLQYFLILVVTYIKELISNFINWLVAGIVALVILFCSFFGIHLSQQGENSISTPTPVLGSTQPLNSSEEIYYANVDITAPQYIKQGQSQVLELNFNLMDKSARGAIPIVLPKANTYTIKVDTQLVNFDFSSPPSDAQENRVININEPVKWQWVVTPRTEAEGDQSIIWNLELKDNKGVTYQDFPTIRLVIQIKPKLGIPSWVLGPNFTLGALISGILLNGIGYSIKRKKEKEENEVNKKRDEEKRKKEEEEQWIVANTRYFALLIVNPKHGVIVNHFEILSGETEISVPLYADKPSYRNQTSAGFYSTEKQIRDKIKNWIELNLGVLVTNMRIIRKKTKENYFYVICNTLADRISAGYFWTGKFREIVGIEGYVDEEMFDLIWKATFSKRDEQ